MSERNGKRPKRVSFEGGDTESTGATQAREKGRASAAYKSAANKHAEAAAAEAAAHREREKLYVAYVKEFQEENPTVFLIVEMGRPKEEGSGTWQPLVHGVYTSARAASVDIHNSYMTKKRWCSIVPVNSKYVGDKDLLKIFTPNKPGERSYIFSPDEKYRCGPIVAIE